LDTALKQCSASIFRDVLINLKNTRSKNTVFYPFALPDAKGKIVTLASLNNKVVILDFWFTGCENCLILHQKMKAIHEKYKSNHKVLFISVSIDKNKQMWLNSVNSGKYTDPKDINLYTAGRGLNDPLIVKYSISGFPTLFVLANGRIFSTEPPRPLSDKASKEFVRVIEAAIAEKTM
jgi:thiol-disulfide isomerase/thioredoxin